MSLTYSEDEKTILPKKLVQRFELLAERSQERKGYGVLRKPNKSYGPFEPHDGRYPYIPLHWRSFFERMDGLLKPGMHVIDVGCGAGDKLALFHKMQPKLRITGLEYDSKLVWHAKRICGKFAKVLQGDARHHDYSEYDLIYMYRPMTSSVGQGAIQDRVIRTMREGATLFVVYSEHINVLTGKYFPVSLDNGWVKPTGYSLDNEPTVNPRDLEYAKKSK